MFLGEQAMSNRFYKLRFAPNSTATVPLPLVKQPGAQHDAVEHGTCLRLVGRSAVGAGDVGQSVVHTNG